MQPGERFAWLEKKSVFICVSVSRTALVAEDQKLKVDGQALSEVELFTTVNAWKGQNQIVSASQGLKDNAFTFRHLSPETNLGPVLKNAHFFYSNLPGCPQEHFIKCFICTGNQKWDSECNVGYIKSSDHSIKRPHSRV